MTFLQQSYGKANVRVLRVYREDDHHDVRECRVCVTLNGAFEPAYTAGDNASIVPTDTMKNLVQVMALEELTAPNESFAMAIAQRLL